MQVLYLYQCPPGDKGMTVRIVLLRRNSGTPGIPAGTFTRTDEMEADRLEGAEATAHQMLYQPLKPRVVRVEIYLDNGFEDTTFEAEQLPDGSVAWYIGPPPPRQMN